MGKSSHDNQELKVLERNVNWQEAGNTPYPYIYTQTHLEMSLIFPVLRIQILEAQSEAENSPPVSCSLSSLPAAVETHGSNSWQWIQREKSFPASFFLSGALELFDITQLPWGLHFPCFTRRVHLSEGGEKEAGRVFSRVSCCQAGFPACLYSTQQGRRTEREEVGLWESPSALRYII